MFDIGFWELMVLAVIGLIVLGPERLPVVARTLGRWVAKARYYAGSITSELEKEVDAEGLRKEIRQAREQVESETRDLRNQTEQSVDSLRNLGEQPSSRSAASTRAEDQNTITDDEAVTSDQATAARKTSDSLASTAETSATASQEHGSDEKAEATSQHETGVNREQ